MKFSEMTYTRPDIDAILAQCRQFAQRAVQAASGEELVQLYYDQSAARADYTTAANLAAYWHYCDTHGKTPDSLLTMCGAGLKSDH